MELINIANAQASPQNNPLGVITRLFRFPCVDIKKIPPTAKISKVFTTGYGENIVKAALKYTDICCINESEAEAVTGITMTKDGEIIPEKVFEAIEKIKELGVSKWIVIHAPKCGFGLDCETGEKVTVPSLKLPKGYIKGSTGAGDAYCSGILYSAHEDKSLEEAMKFARCSAACSLSENNGTDGMRSADKVIALEAEFGELEI